jgi:hypothetical protein
MDHRRLSTADVLYMGITDLPVPVIDVPKDTPRFDVDPDEPLPTSAMAHALESGMVLQCRAPYGVAYAWRAGVCCRGLLLQYRDVTEDHTFTTATEAVVWFADLIPQIAG